MTKQEFTNRTQVEVSNSEFDMINEFYMNCECDKDEFCKMWCKMNPERVKNAKVERMIQKKEAAYKDALYNWFNKWDKTQKFFDNYHTSIAYIKMSTFEIQALSYAGILFHENISLSDIHFKVGQYLGIYRS
jgi:hypothetical protein